MGVLSVNSIQKTVEQITSQVKRTKEPKKKDNPSASKSVNHSLSVVAGAFQKAAKSISVLADAQLKAQLSRPERFGDNYQKIMGYAMFAGKEHAVTPVLKKYREANRKLLDHPDESVRIRAIRALYKIGDKAILPALKKIILKKTYVTLDELYEITSKSARWLCDDDYQYSADRDNFPRTCHKKHNKTDIDKDLVRMYITLAEPDAVISLLRREVGILEATVETRKEFNRLKDQLLNRLLPLKGDKRDIFEKTVNIISAQLHAEIINLYGKRAFGWISLSKLISHRPKVQEYFLEMLDYNNEEVFWLAWDALNTDANYRCEEVHKAMLSIWKENPDWYLRMKARQYLSKAVRNGARSATLAQGLIELTTTPRDWKDNSNKRIERTVALDMLKRIKDPSIHPQLVDFIKNPSNVRSEAIEVLTALGRAQSTKEALMRIVMNKEDSWRGDAIMALGKLKYDDLIPLFSRIALDKKESKDTRYSAAIALGHLKGSVALKTLVAVLGNKELSRHERRGIVRDIEKVGGSRALMHVLTAKRNTSVYNYARYVTVDRLSRIKATPQTISALKSTLLHDPDAGVKAAAVDAISNMRRYTTDAIADKKFLVSVLMRKRSDKKFDKARYYIMNAVKWDKKDINTLINVLAQDPDYTVKRLALIDLCDLEELNHPRVRAELKRYAASLEKHNDQVELAKLAKRFLDDR